MKVSVAFFLVLAALNGCATQNAPKIDPMPEPKVENDIDEEIRRVSHDIHEDLEIIRQIKQANAPKVHVWSKTRDPSLSKPLTLSWQGDPVKAIREIANRIDYRVHIQGRRPLHLNPVVVDVRRQPAIEIIADIGWQMGERAGVVVNEKDRVIEVVYVGR